MSASDNNTLSSHDKSNLEKRHIPVITPYINVRKAHNVQTITALLGLKLVANY